MTDKGKMILDSKEQKDQLGHILAGVSVQGPNNARALVELAEAVGRAPIADYDRQVAALAAYTPD